VWNGDLTPSTEPVEKAGTPESIVVVTSTRLHTIEILGSLPTGTTEISESAVVVTSTRVHTVHAT
jgi:hypothetical protein